MCRVQAPEDKMRRVPPVLFLSLVQAPRKMRLHILTPSADPEPKGRNFESVRQRLETATDVLEKLFPSQSIDALSGLSREELLEKLASSSRTATLRKEQSRMSLPPGTNDHDSVTSAGLLPAGVVQTRCLNQGHKDGAATDTAVMPQADDGSSEAGDDVNALSATSAQPSSYVGPSSTMQLFRTILRIAPESTGQQRSCQSPTTSQRSGSIRSPDATYRTPPAVQTTERINTLIDAYFNWVHPATPVLDEAEFRKTASSGARNDSPWLCLFNMVLALGSIGTTRKDSREHLTYYQAAKSHLDLEGLGNKSFETLQALILMAGWYNHYRNRPNLASALLGAAFRMAYALGLHKELPGSSEPEDRQELRRKIWWNLVVFDAAEAVTLGRALDTKIFETEVQCPRDVLDGALDSPSSASILVITIGFSRIMIEIQSRLMTTPALPFTESLSLDAHLVDWYEALPTYFHRLVGNLGSTVLEASASKRFIQPFLTIKWRYLNLRLLLYRPSLMEAVLHRIPFSELTSDQRLCIRKCLTLSGETIDSAKLRSSETPNQYIAWPTTWYLLQICMVPLLSLYVFREDINDQGSRLSSIQHTGFKHSSSGRDSVRQIRDECHRQVQVTLSLVKDMEPWAVASGKMHDLISHLYEARDQHLRVWNNTEESPVLVLGSPDSSSMQQAVQSRARTVNHDHGTTSNTHSKSNNIFPAEYTTAIPENINFIPSTQPHIGSGVHNNPTGQLEQFSRDWSRYNSFTWPNATLESLFDLPDEFQYISQDPFGVG
ncbi:hypothetical protein PV04_04398 [Phialophora macrospora]|uniref:Xylanolytic transcriptional activator regulatory domain-containing protein n=1 Tax=Phialophora macrospora TaxID=1851006 RepID=A0A0D2FPE7_9EURO|nr:hypothetical protein PV04_04398 [Phialophora macrospora]